MSAPIGIGVFLIVIYLTGVAAGMIAAMAWYDPAFPEWERKEAASRFRAAWKWPLEAASAVAEIWREGRE